MFVKFGGCYMVFQIFIDDKYVGGVDDLFWFEVVGCFDVLFNF